MDLPSDVKLLVLAPEGPAIGLVLGALSSLGVAAYRAGDEEEATSALLACRARRIRFDACMVDASFLQRSAPLATIFARAAAPLPAVIFMRSSGERMQAPKMAAQTLKHPICEAILQDALGSLSVPSAPAKRATERPLILLAEDQPINRRVAVGMLKRWADVIEACDGEAAVEAMRVHRPDLIFMDCQMPVMDGYQAAQEIRNLERSEARARTPIVALTANSFQSDREQCLQAGMDEVVTKPFMRRDLKEALMRWSLLSEETEARRAAETKEAPAVTLDLTALAELRGDDGDGEAFLEDVVREYTRATHSDLNLLSEAVAAKDAVRSREVAHTIKGLSGTLGAARVAQTSATIERRAADNELDGLGTEVRKLRHDVARAVEAMRRQLS